MIGDVLFVFLLLFFSFCISVLSEWEYNAENFSRGEISSLNDPNKNKESTRREIEW